MGQGGLGYMRRFSPLQVKRALICSFIVIAVLFFLFIKKEPLIVFGRFQLKNLVLLVFQVLLIIGIARYPMPSQARKKGLIAISMFILIRNIPLMVPFNLARLNYSLPWFLVFFIFYFIAAALALEALKEVHHD